MSHRNHLAAIRFLCLGLMVYLLSGCNGSIVSGSSPIADPGPDQTVIVGEEVILDGSGSIDPTGGPLTYLWEQTSGPIVVLTAIDEPITTFLADIPGSYEFVLTVENAQGLASSAAVLVTVIP